MEKFQEQRDEMQEELERLRGLLKDNRIHFEQNDDHMENNFIK